MPYSEVELAAIAWVEALERVAAGKSCVVGPATVSNAKEQLIAATRKLIAGRAESFGDRR